jgi:putative Mg2+ transporter-C (MgtC) family protein
MPISEWARRSQNRRNTVNLLTPENLDMALRLTSAIFLGGIIGLEREAHGKDAGFRTYALVCLGSSLMMVISTQIFEAYKDIAEVDPSRIAAQVVTGIGFLGAGAIIRFPEGGKQGGIKGLTTAAGIWAASGIGLACGLAFYAPAIMATVLTLLVLIVFARVDRWFGGKDN